MKAWGRRPLRPGTNFAVRQPQPRWSPRQRALWLSAVVLTLALVSGGVYWALHTPVFAVTRIETGSYRFTSPAALDSVLGNFLGRNLFSLGSSEVADSMATLAWVRDLRVQRRLPRVLAVDFREWRPLAVVAQQDLPVSIQGRNWVLGENGRILEFPGELEVPALPTLMGCRFRSSGAQGNDVAILDEGDNGGEMLLELFQAMAEVGLESVAAVDFVVVRPEGCAIVLEGSQGRLQVGRKDFRSRLERYLTARPHLEPGLEVDLRFADRVTVHRPSTGAPADH